MPFLTDSEFRAAVFAHLKVSNPEPAAYWDQLCKDAHETAYKDIRGALLARGMTAAQVDAWDRGKEFERHIGLYWAAVLGDWPGFDSERIKLLDRREELLTVTVETAAGSPQTPAGSPAVPVYGTFDTFDAATGNDDTWTKDMTI